MTVRRMQQLSMSALALATMLFATGAFAQADCSRVPEQYRARCEQGAKLKALCAGLTGEGRKHCEQRHIDYATAGEDCTSLAGEARLGCEQRSRLMYMATPCKDKAGAELDACIKAQVALRAR